MPKRRIPAKTYFKELFTLFAVFFKIGLFSFGGGYAMLTLIESEVVEKRPWLSHNELADIFAIAESTPGPIAINTATFIGTKRLGIFGGIFATLGVVVPSFAIIVALSYVIDVVKDNRWVGYLFQGIKIGVLVLISKAVITFYKDMRKNLFSFALMIASFFIVFFTNVSVIYIILSTIVLCAIVVAFRHYFNKRFYHSIGTPAYYCEKVGKKLEKDEYVRETADKTAICAQSTAAFDIISSESTENEKPNIYAENIDSQTDVCGDNALGVKEECLAQSETGGDCNAEKEGGAE